MQRMCSQLCFVGLMGTRRMRFCTSGGTAPSPWGASSQELFAELAWHPGPALEWAQPEKGIEVTRKCQILKLHLEHSLSSASTSPSSSSTPAHCSSTSGPCQAPPVTLLRYTSSCFLLQGLCIVCHTQVQPRKLPALHLLLEQRRFGDMRMVCNSLRDQAKAALASLCRPQSLQWPQQWPFAASPLQDKRDELWCCSLPAPC